MALHLRAGNPEGTLGEGVFNGIRLLLTEPAADSRGTFPSLTGKPNECRNRRVQVGSARIYVHVVVRCAKFANPD